MTRLPARRSLSPASDFPGTAWRFFFSGLAFLAIAGAVAFASIRNLRNDAALVTQSSQILAVLASVDGELTKAGSARRGFLLVRDSSFVRQYRSSRDHVDDLFEELKESTNDAPASTREHLRHLRAAAGQRLDLMAVSIRNVATDHEAPQELLPNDENARKIRDELNELVAEERRLLATREGRAELTEIAAETSMAGGFTLALALFFLAWRRSVRSALQRDESERLLAERALELDVANRQLEQLLFAASGRLQDPLRAIQDAALSIARQASLQQAERAPAMAQLSEGASRMSRIVSDLRTYAQLVGYEPAHDRLALDDVVQRVLREFAPRLKTANGVVHVDLSLPHIVGDRRLLEWALVQLIDNALSFSKPGTAPAVYVGARASEGLATLYVRDEGIGILRDYHARIFGLFERLAPEMHPGSGIGLPIAQRAAELMGSRVQVESEPGVGSEFTLVLPLAR
ncbi:MAG: CHASE3 domain-containing protein [Gemmatimonadetes bacterium]|nr:CHASE3 domain-containing protein [Gemmatimonadota bacterium]